MRGKKKLIEVALPLEAINKASGREKSIRHGHPYVSMDEGIAAQVLGGARSKEGHSSEWPAVFTACT